MLDCVVVGAGAAGIGAGLALLRAKASFVILEAKDRTGGRAFTDTQSLGYAWDHGCHWFHSASVNPLRKMALKIGHAFEDVAKPYTNHVWMKGDFVSDFSDMHAAYDGLSDRMASIDRNGPDMPVSVFMDTQSPWHLLMRHGMALNSSHEAEQISVLDSLAYFETNENIAVKGGYGNLFERMATGLPIRLDTAVQSIEVRPDSVRVVTPSGTREALSVVLAVPARVMERGDIRFAPALPLDIQDVFQNVTMGWFEKVGFTFDAPLLSAFGEGGVETVVHLRGEDTPVYFHLNSNGCPTAIAHVAGHLARELNEVERMALCEDALLKCFGSSVRQHIVRRATSYWRDDPFIGGAYAAARPGSAHLRQRLQQPIHDRVHFAGEHTSLTAMATAHGAYVSGLEAAQKAMRNVGREIGVEPLWLPT